MQRAAAVLSLLAALGVLAPPALAAGAPRPRFGPRPAWVEPLSPGVPSRARDFRGGTEYLLVDDQVRVEPGGAVHWAMRTRRVTSLQGVDAESSFQLDWDPVYETLTIHRIVVRRGDQEMNRLQPEAIEVVRREPAFEASLLDGTLSALILIPDVRVGDVIEHEYSLAGTNPVFAGHWSGGFNINWGVVVRRLGFRLLWPEGRAMHWQLEGTDQEPGLARLGAGHEARWLFENPPAVETEGDEPAWFDPAAGVWITDFASWGEVARWALPLYEVPPLDQDLAELVRRLQEGAAGDEERALAAIRFVQDEVRYLGLEIGTGSHRPTDPGRVLERRFGDCKDKTLLLITLLRAMGLVADPALVSTIWQSELDRRLPSPMVFDHVIVRLRVGGSEHWIDSTISGQRGGLAVRHVPRLGKALVLRQDTSRLSDVRPAPGDMPRTDVEARFVLPSVGGPGSMTMRTSYVGRDADAVRASLSGESREQTERAYREYYARVLPGLEQARPLVIRDDEHANILVTEEAYRIAEPWILSDDGQSWMLELRAPEIEAVLVEPEKVERESPLALDHPRHVRHRMILELPSDWDVEDEDIDLEGPGAVFTRKVRSEERRVEVECEWTSLVEWIPAGEVPDHAAMVREAFESTGFLLSATDGGRPLGRLRETPAPRGPNWSALALGLVTAVSASALALALLLRPARTAAPGRGGIMLVVAAAAGLLLPVALASQLAASIPSHDLAAFLQWSTPGQPGHHPFLAPLLLLILVMNVAALPLSLALLPLLGSRRRSLRWALPAACLATGGIILARALLADAWPRAFPGAWGIGWALAAAAACVLLAAWVAGAPRSREALPR